VDENQRSERMTSVRTKAPKASANHPTELYLLCGTQLLVPTVARTLIWLDRLPTAEKNAAKKAMNEDSDKAVEALLVAERNMRNTVPGDVGAPIDERDPDATANLGDFLGTLTQLNDRPRGVEPSEAKGLPRRIRMGKK
jgi:hypothetical protein